MRRTLMLGGYGKRGSLDLNIWLNKHPQAELVSAHAFPADHGITVLAIVEVPEGTKIYKNESEENPND